MNRQRYLKKWLRWHKSYERRADVGLRRVFKEWSNSILWGSMTRTTYLDVIRDAINTAALNDTLFTIHKNIGLAHGNRVRAGINEDLKAITPGSFALTYLNFLTDYFSRYGVNRVKTISETYFEVIAKLFSERLEGGQGVDFNTIVDEVMTIVDRPTFYKWQAKRIARTEATGAANSGALAAGDSSVYEMQKEWVSRQDKKTRIHPEDPYDHYDMDGVKVRLHETFSLPSDDPKYPNDKMQHPGDQAGHAADVINCRCTIAVSPMRDKDGRLIRKGDLPKEVKSSMQIFEDEIRRQKYESAAFYDKNGVEVFRKNGNTKSVSFEPHEVALILKNKDGVLTHNHPNPWSFSKADIVFLGHYDMKGIRAVNELNEDYLMEFDKEGANNHYYRKSKLNGAIKRAYTASAKKVKSRLRPDYLKLRDKGLKGEELSTEYTKLYYDKLWEIFTTETKVGSFFKYTRLWK